MNFMLEYNGYHATITYDADDELFVGQVFGITDSLNFHGSSIEEPKQTFAQSIDNYLDLCKQIGKEPEKEFKGSLMENIYVMCNKANYDWLMKGKTQIENGQFAVHALFDVEDE